MSLIEEVIRLKGSGRHAFGKANTCVPRDSAHGVVEQGNRSRKVFVTNKRHPAVVCFVGQNRTVYELRHEKQFNVLAATQRGDRAKVAFEQAQSPWVRRACEGLVTRHRRESLASGYSKINAMHQTGQCE